uniref:Transmembrane protein 216 n=1 Tax=Parascaris univalens TaxID=6257 RepID=A0A914ZMZ1_PARUN
MISNVRSSLSYQIFLHISQPYSALFFIAELGLYFFKVSILPYPNNVAICDFLLIVLFAPVEALRIFWGRKGNLTETSAFISFSLLLSVAVLAVCIYWAVFQSYVLLIEFIVVCIEGGLVVIESLLGIITVATLSRPISI